MHSINIVTLIYCYLVLCLGLFLFNILSIGKNKWEVKRRERRVLYWMGHMDQAYKQQQVGEVPDVNHEKKLRKYLIQPEELIAFEEAYDMFCTQYGQRAGQQYLQDYSKTFVYLAGDYSKKHPMEKACFAYFIGNYWPGACQDNHVLSEIIGQYLIGSTVYCRENVLKALYRLGSCQTIVYAFRMLSEYRYFHHPKLLADGLMTFSGDRNALAQMLWVHHKAWHHELVVAMIQWMMGIDESFAEALEPLLRDPGCHIEVRLAILRYYKKHYYAPIESLLHEYIQDPACNENLGIVAAATLENYPSDHSTQVLRQALCHKVWYIRHNAATSLIARGLTEQEIKRIVEGPDRYASEMLSYRLQVMKRQGLDVMKEVS